MLLRSLVVLSALFCAILMGSRASSAQSITIFGNGAPPDGAINGSYMPPRAGATFGKTLGVKFWSSQIGVISGIRFYTVVCPGGYVADLYSADGTLLGSGTAVDASPDPGWREADFASPIPISANTTYIAAYYCAAGLYTYLPEGLSQGVTNGPLTAPASSAVGGNGVYSHRNVFLIRSYQDSNYYVDIVFTPPPSPPNLTLSFNPANPSVVSDLPAGTVVSTITATWSDGSPFTGTLSFGPPNSDDNGTFVISGNQLIVNPAGSGLSADGDTTQLVTIVATQ